MPTAVSAVWSNGARPTVPSYAEYGAVAGLLSTQHAMRENGNAGTLQYTGEPAEKMH